ncbi:Lipid A export ATP-binding/permease protein MsbA [Candidatus Rubidus massiliensis]|nr:Lipid A export ATP-binding/permease protein MsbA [Candidatus Rubidus massiliensis]
MKKLLLLGFSKSQYRTMIFITLVSMCLATIASQLEMFSIGIITKKGPDVFELFAPIENGVLNKGENLDVDLIPIRLKEIDISNKKYITSSEINQFMSEHNHSDIVQSGINIINRFLPISNNFTNLAIFLVFVAIFKAITLFAYRFATKLVAIKISRDLRQSYFEHIQSLPMDFYQKHDIGTLSSRVVGDASIIAEAVNSCLINYFQTPFTIITTLTICFFASWQLSLMIFIGFPLIVYPIFFLAKKVKKISKQIQKNQEKFASVIIDFLAGIQTVKVFAMENFSLQKYKEHNDHMANLEKRNAKYDLSSRPIVHTIAMFFLATALIYGLYVLHLSVSEVLVFCGLLYIFYEPFKKFAEENSQIQRGVAAAERMFEVLDLKPQIQDSPTAVNLEEFKDHIEFKDVWFKYNDEWILQGLNFKVKKGEMVAIVGPTGAGKSTIVQLLPRLYEIQQGEILIDGKPLTTYTQKSLRERMAFVPQRPFLFLDSITANISYGQKFDPLAIKQAAERAQAHEFIENLPLKYETVLSETGKNLSGGQQQRLAIARALVKNAPILIMDEATSSLDSVSENKIKESIQQLRGQVTQIIIAHRLSTIEDADKIIYIEKGQKVAEGSKQELLKTCRGFSLMWEMMHRS